MSIETKQLASRWCADLLQIVPASDDSTLLKAVIAHLQKSARGDWKPFFAPPLFFLGERAKTPRAKTEVYWAKEGPALAERTAQLLEPLIGPTKIQKWPGQWDYDVVVVVGEERN